MDPNNLPKFDTTFNEIEDDLLDDNTEEEYMTLVL